MSFTQSIKDYFFQPQVVRTNKENNPSQVNLQAKKKTTTLAANQKNKVSNKSTLLPYNIESNLHAAGQEAKDSSFSQRMNINKVKKALTFDKNPHEVTKKDQKDKTLFLDSSKLAAQKGKTLFGNTKNLAPLSTRSVTNAEQKKESLETKEIRTESNEEQFTSSQAKSTSSFVGDVNLETSQRMKKDEAKERNNQMIRDYAQDIIESLKEKDRTSRVIYCLENHKISPSLRAKMVDWMIEVLCSYKSSDQTFFLAVSIMDNFLRKTKTPQAVSDLHLVGVTSMFIASKYEEIYPMKLSIIHEKVAHKKLSIEEILQKEGEIISTLGFNLVSISPFEYVTNVLFQLRLKDTMTTELYDYLQRVCLYLCKANLYDYELISQFDACQLAGCTLFVAFKVTEQVDSNFPVTALVDNVCEILGVEDEVLYSCATNILNLAKNFEKLYPTFKNLKKYHSIGAPGKEKSSSESIINENKSAPSS